MKKMKRVLCLIITTFMLFSLIAGCSDKSGKEDKNTQVDASKSTTSSEASTAKDATEQKSGPSWSWDNSPIKIDWFLAEDWYKKEWNSEKCVFDKYVTEKTGISINISTGNVDKLNALIASNSLPDVITMYYAYPQRTLLENTGKVLPLNELITKYAPTFKYPKSMENWFRNKDGNWYAFNNFFWAPEEMTDENYFVTHNTFQARKDIMDKLGIKEEDFSSKQGTIEALKKVRDSKIEYKGIKVVPFYIGHLNMDGGVFNLAQHLGLVMEDRDGNYVDYRKDAKGLEALKFLNELYREKLMPEENLTISRNQVAEYILKGSAFSHMGWATVAQRVVDFTNSDTSASYVPVGPILGDEKARPYLNTSGLIGWTSTLITKNAKNPERIIRFFEFMYSDEMQINHLYGVEGKVWERDSEGKIKYLDEYIKARDENPEKTKAEYGVDTFFPFVNWVTIQRAKFAKNPNEKPNIGMEKSAVMEKYYAQYAFDDKCFCDVSPDGGSDEAGIAAKIDDYWKKQIAKMIMAKSEAEVESVFNETSKHMDELGYAKMYEVMNQKFKDNKARLGIKYAWPGYKN